MQITCPQCATSLDLPDAARWQDLTCPGCGSDLPREGPTTIDFKALAGQRVGRFELLQAVGQGGFGTVYKARDPQLDRTVALKVPRAGRLAGPQELDRFLREARSVARLRHPGIVPVHEVGEHEGLPYLVSDFVEGITLADLLSARRPSFADGARLVAAVADALHYAHGQGVVHRDVKPSNVMLEAGAADPAGLAAPRLMDFGLARRDGGESTLTQEGQALGTPAYMSPEQARGEGHRADGRSDVWSLGAVLYQLLTGELPFRGNPRMTLHQVLHEEPRPPRSLNDQVPRDLETICLKCLQKEANKRYATAGELADDLRRWAAGEPIRARPVGRLERAWRWCRRRPAAAGLLAASALLVAGAFGAALWYVQDRAERRAEQAVRTAQVESGIRLALGAAVKRRDEAFRQTERPEQWQAGMQAAFSELRRAEVLLATDPERVAGELRGQLRQLRGRLEADEENRAAAGRLDDLRLEATELVAGKPQPRHFAPRYAAEFDRLGLAVATEDLAALAGRIGQSSIRGHLVAALDEWAVLADKDAALRGRLLALARAADPDPWRDRLRDPKVWQSVPGLEALANDPAAARQPPYLLTVLGRQLHTLGGDDAAAVLRLAQERRPGDFWVNCYLGHVSFRERRVADAVGYYRAAVALRPDNAAICADLGFALAEQQDLRGAAAAYRRAIHLDPKYARAHNNLGIVLWQQQDLKGAVAACKEALKLDPKHALAYNNLGLALYGLNDFAGAAAAYKQAILVAPDLSPAHSNLGNALLALKDVPGAVAAHKEAVRVDPKNAQAHTNLGLTLAEQKDLKGAVAAHKQAILLEPKDARAHNNLGLALSALKDFAGAAAAYKQAILLEPKVAAAHTNLGSALRGLKDLPGAVAACKQAILLEPESASAHYNLGLTLHAMKDLPGAAAAFKRATVINPNDAAAHNNLGAVLSNMKDLPGAAAAYKKATLLRPDYATAHYNLGVVLHAQEDLPGAVAAYKQAILLNPGHAEAHCNLGHALRDSGRFRDALASLKRGHELGSKRPTWPYKSAEWVRECELLVELDGEAQAVLKGESQPALIEGWADYADLCRRKRHFLDGVTCFRHFFLTRADLVVPVGAPYYYNAACLATLAGCGQGEDAAELTAQQRAGLRRQALDWLRTDLADWGRALKNGDPQLRRRAQTILRHWQRDTNLAGVRDAKALAALPEAERQRWQQLWTDVAELLKQTAEK